MTRHERALREIESDLRRKAALVRAALPDSITDRLLTDTIDAMDAVLQARGLRPSRPETPPRHEQAGEVRG